MLNEMEIMSKTSHIKPVNCKCSYEARAVGYCGGNTGKYRISCTCSFCPSVVEVTGKKEDCIDKWNQMQTSI